MNHTVFRIRRTANTAARLSRKVIALGVVALLMCWPGPNYVQASEGDLDPTFGSGGKVTADFGNSVDGGNAVALQSDGKIVVAGSALTGISTQHDFALARYNGDGSLDVSFGTGGRVKTDFFGLGDEAFAIALQKDGKIIAAGTSGLGTSDVIGESNPDFALARYNDDGSLDPTFGNGGKVTTDFFGLKDQVFAIAIQNDGKILAVGSASFSSIFGLARYNADGSPDTSFGIGSKVTTAFGSFANFAHAVAIQSDGKIVVAGTTFTNFFKFGVARYNSDGSLDLTFGTGGKVITSFSFLDDQCFALALQTDGKIVVAGAANYFSRFGLARYNTDGSLDTSFGVGGIVTTVFPDPALGFARANAIIIQNNEKIIAIGAASNPGTFSDFALARYNSDGSLDASFGAAGKVTNDFFGLGDQANAAVLQRDGRIVVAGTATANNSELALVRYDNVDLHFPLITSATIDGKKLTVFGRGFDDGAKVLLNGDKQKTRNDEDNPTTVLIAKRAGKLIAPGQAVTLQVRNSDGTLSEEFLFARPN